VSNLNGHSGAVVRNHYLFRQRQRDVQQCQDFLAMDLPSPVTANVSRQRQSPSLSALPVRGMAQSLVRINLGTILAKVSKKEKPEIDSDLDGLIARIEWGRKHPHYNSKSDKIPWSSVEDEFIAAWTQETLRSEPHVHSLANKCRSALIRHHPDFHAYFHREHIITRGRFVHGLRRHHQLMAYDEQSSRSSKHDFSIEGEVHDLTFDSDNDNSYSYSDSSCKNW